MTTSRVLRSRRDVVRRITLSLAALSLSPAALRASVAGTGSFRYGRGDDPATPETALPALRDGNRRFVAGKGTGPHRDLRHRRGARAVDPTLARRRPDGT